jgi:hypothetical protein
MRVERLFATGALSATRPSRRRLRQLRQWLEWWATWLAVSVAGVVTALGLVW